MLLSPWNHANVAWTPIDNRMVFAQHPLLNLVASDVEVLAKRLPIIIRAVFNGAAALPEVLITPTDQYNPFGDYTPRTIQDYPFTLVRDAMYVDETGHPSYQNGIWADPNAQHWNTPPGRGFRLFDDEGYPSQALREVIGRLHALAEEAEHTRNLVYNLYQAGGLVHRVVQHYGQNYQVFAVTLDGLQERLRDLNLPEADEAFILASHIAESQRQMHFYQSMQPTNPYGV